MIWWENVCCFSSCGRKMRICLCCSCNPNAKSRLCKMEAKRETVAHCYGGNCNFLSHRTQNCVHARIGEHCTLVSAPPLCTLVYDNIFCGDLRSMTVKFRSFTSILFRNLCDIRWRLRLYLRGDESMKWVLKSFDADEHVAKGFGFIREDVYLSHQ